MAIAWIFVLGSLLFCIDGALYASECAAYAEEDKGTCEYGTVRHLPDITLNREVCTSAHETVVLPLQVSRIARSTSAVASSSWWLVACGCGWRWGLIAPWAMETSSPRLEHQSAAFRQRNVRCNVCDATDEVLLASALRVGTPMLVHLPRVSRVLSRSVRAARPHSVDISRTCSHRKTTVCITTKHEMNVHEMNVE